MGETPFDLDVCLVGDALTQLRRIPDGLVQTCVTSPPYWGLRDYQAEGQLGVEPQLQTYVDRLVEIFREVRRVLRQDGTLWLNLGDSYNGSGGSGGASPKQMTNPGSFHDGGQRNDPGLKPKDLCGIPWRVALALQADGWWLRSDIIWHKPNPIPSSVTDRPTLAHEYVFLLSKSARYFYRADAIAEPSTNAGKVVLLGEKSLSKGQAAGSGRPESGNASADSWTVKDTRNRRSVWTVPTGCYPDAHFATWPPKLVSTMIQGGSQIADIVLDPFMGSGTTAMVAQDLGRRWIGVEINPDYIALQKKRTAQMGLFGLPGVGR